MANAALVEVNSEGTNDGISRSSNEINAEKTVEGDENKVTVLYENSSKDEIVLESASAALVQQMEKIFFIRLVYDLMVVARRHI